MSAYKLAAIKTLEFGKYHRPEEALCHRDEIARRFQFILTFNKLPLTPNIRDFEMRPRSIKAEIIQRIEFDA